ncbi:tyrosine-type recombinase/integrase [Roseivirga sp. BDSF3-8]|uniref:tyrosine-type recombinase/integrase n=1 Tax=Roseivirga sp. BDSF3-8 TaxID=3241598 RepID=UPI003531A474
MTFAKAQEYFLDHCQFEKNLSAKTLEFYAIDLRQFQSFLKNYKSDSQIGKIDKYVLKDYLKYIAHFKPKTVKRKLATLKAFFNFLEFEDIIMVNPFRKLRVKIKEPRRLPNLMSTHEVQKIFKAAYTAKEATTSDGDYLTKLRDIAVLELLFATGIRVSELCDLKDKNINLQNGVITINGKGSKERLIQVCNPGVLRILCEYRRYFEEQIEQSGYFFINRLDRRLSDQSIRRLIRGYTQLAAIDKNITPHTFRHTFATLLLEEDVDIKYIQHFLGHSSIATTQIYTHVNSAKQQQILSTKHPRNGFEFGSCSDSQ